MSDLPSAKVRPSGKVAGRPPLARERDSRWDRMLAALTDFRDDQRWPLAVNRQAKAALRHWHQGAPDACDLCGEPRPDLIHFYAPAKQK